MPDASPATTGSVVSLAGIDPHPHARAVLLPALAGAGAGPSHAYLFHGPSGVGKREVARAFAAELLAEGGADPKSVRERVRRGSHPDLTWVTPSGASELLVGDIDEAVIGAVAHTPFESRRRVFVIEAAGTMNDQAANRLLKTLEEPPPFAHLILLAEHREDVLPTVASRCQPVRFDPLSSERVQERLVAAEPAIDPERARACARLSGGDVALAERLAGEQGAGLRAAAEFFVRAALCPGAPPARPGEGLAGLGSDSSGPGAEAAGGRARAAGGAEPAGGGGERPWTALLAAAKQAGVEAGAAAAEWVGEQAELLPVRERRRHEREGAEAVRRAERRARTATLDLALRLAELWLRDAWCVAVGAGELVLACDRLTELQADAARHSPDTLRARVELVRDTRLRLALNVSEELALEALAHRLVGPDASS